MSLGRFLEVSIVAPDIAASLAFYESLGFVQAPVGEAWPHPYAVVTDGRLYLGLHQRADAPGPALTWVLPELAQQLPRLEALGIEFSDYQVDEAALNRADFADPSGQAVTLLEARTFSSPTLPATHASALGYFEEFGIPTLELAVAAAFWERLGFVAFDAVTTPFGKIVATGRDLNLGLYDLDLRGPVLAFSDPDMPDRIEALRDKGCDFARRLPRGLAASGGAILQAPEGTALLLLGRK
jgi:catechol 2,3-dioxygenase-like lactoylglutathione lyase family enzyme